LAAVDADVARATENAATAVNANRVFDKVFIVRIQFRILVAGYYLVDRRCGTAWL
jgi:hypothetical protein